MVRRILSCSIVVALSFGCASSRDRSFTIDGVRIHAMEEGQGPPIVLIHGYWDSIDITWRSTGVMDALARDCRVLAIDCRGHGESDMPHADVYGAEMVRDVARAMDRAGIDSAHIVGHSMGAMISVRFAADFPERVRSLTLIGAGAAPPGNDPALMERVADALEHRNTLRPMIEFIWPDGAPPPTDAEVAEIDAAAFATNEPLALAAVARGFDEFIVTDPEAHAIGAPAAGVVGSNDPMAGDVDRLARVMGDLEIVVVPDADHMSILTRAELVAAIRAHVDAAERAGWSSPSPAAHGDHAE